MIEAFSLNEISNKSIINRCIGVEPTLLSKDKDKYKSFGKKMSNSRNLLLKVNDFILKNNLKHISCVNLDEFDLEFETIPINKFTKKSYLNKCKEIVLIQKHFEKHLEFWNDSKCNGGNHFQLDMPFKNKYYNERLLYNLHIDLINNPEILWLFNDPIDDCNAVNILYNLRFSIMSKTINYNSLSFQNFTNTYLEYEILENTKRYAIGTKKYGKILEFRFFDMWENLEEAEFQYDFLMKWMQRNIEFTASNNIRVLEKNPNRYKSFTFNKSIIRITKFMKTSLNIILNENDHEKFIWNLKERFHYKTLV